MTGPSYQEWRPPARLARHVACTWAGRMGPGGESYVERVLPDGCVDLVWDGTRLLVAGPDTGPVDIVRRPDGFYVGVRFRPGLAPSALGLPASELLDRRVDGADVLGAERAARLTERLAAASSLPAAAVELAEAVSAWLPKVAREPDELVEATVAVLGRGSGAVGRPVAALADALGVSERQLHRRCRAAVGYGPKTLDRVLRFRRFLALTESEPTAGLAHLAAAAGYADQSHLSRECGRLAGTTPAGLLGV
ncbi:MAG TPA: DUF6597 domain-containing transcriptional factor [Acidimicrobiales bacterium]